MQDSRVFVCFCAVKQVRAAQDVFEREQMGTQMLLERMLHDSFMLCLFLQLIVSVCAVVTLMRLYKHNFIPAKAKKQQAI